MKRRLLYWLRCPSCRGELRLSVRREEPTASPSSDHPIWQQCDRTDISDRTWSYEIKEGTLTCACGDVYAIRAGIPRMHETDSGGAKKDEPNDPSRAPSSRTQTCYNYLWQFKRDRIGWQRSPTTAEADFFLLNMGLSSADVATKTLLDAGCGDGRLTSALADLGLETIGVDLSEGVDIGYANNTSPLVHYVQGDLLRPPFRRHGFDYIWSFGVLHHTRSTQRAFAECVALLAPGGRLFVWIYDKAPRRRGALIRATQKAPLVVKRSVSAALGFANRCKRLVGSGSAVTHPQSNDEVFFWNMDMYGPEFRHLHPADEVEGWFHHHGFENVAHRGRMEFGFGMTGDLRP